MNKMTNLPKSTFDIKLHRNGILNALAQDIIDAQYKVNQWQACVNSLTEKSIKYQSFIALAETNKTSALSNKNTIDQISEQIQDLKNSTEVTFNEIVNASVKTKILATQIKSTLDKLIYSADLIDKLATQTVRKKALNPLISDDLISILSKSRADANNAVALTLIALQSTYASQASTIEAEAALTLQYSQSMALYQFVTDKKPLHEDKLKDNNLLFSKSGLIAFFYKAYDEAQNYFEQMQEANTSTNLQLNNANAQLSKAEVKLKSLQSALVAANAASNA
jgi:ribosomal 50S subunit-recycling heat shock protein